MYKITAKIRRKIKLKKRKLVNVAGQTTLRRLHKSND